MHTTFGMLLSLALVWSHSAHADLPVAFVDVNVLPMDRQHILQHQTVLVQDKAILQIGPLKGVPIPEGAQRIEGNGTAYLLPGLADMHVHVSKPDDLALYVANGVTTVLHMGGDPIAAVGVISQGIESAPIASPRIFFAFKLHGGGEGLTVSTPELARSAVQLAKANGYDFIKVYNELSPPVFAAIVAEAQNQGMAVVGHGVRSVGLPKALFEGQVMVAHAEEFLYTAFEDHEDRSRIKSVVADTFRSGAYVTTTLSTNEVITRQWGRPKQVDARSACGVHDTQRARRLGERILCPCRHAGQRPRRRRARVPGRVHQGPASQRCAAARRHRQPGRTRHVSRLLDS
ncbi:hypothetical protein [Hydrocarboniphaga sp.]|uniref:amidohydrolase family protein n=1 Tax=Hydrocarboniphaga sp. TaxID=2033016 RepID=UPI002636DF89|nr:hypothetical protein [Hydrocarboniphaga sp.]